MQVIDYFQGVRDAAVDQLLELDSDKLEGVVRRCDAALTNKEFLGRLSDLDDSDARRIARETVAGVRRIGDLSRVRRDYCADDDIENSRDAFAELRGR